MTEDIQNFIRKFLPLALITIALGGFYLWQLPSNGTANNPIPKSSSGLDSLEDYYNTALNLGGGEQASEVSFYAVGDIMLSRQVAKKIDENQQDGFWPFRNLADRLLETDFNFGNLESPYSGSNFYPATGSLIFNAPTWTMPGLVQHNFKILSLANNHAMDQGLDGLLFTKKFLAENYAQGIGVGRNLDEAWRGEVFSVKGVRVGFIAASYSSVNDGGATKNNNVARIEDTNKLKDAIAELKTRADFIVVSMHAGTEYVRNPNQAQTNFARAAIDNGADLVIGHHPHWIQTIEEYQGKYIFYSLGNFVFDQMWSQDTKEGLMIKVTIEKEGSCAFDLRLSPSGQQEVTCGDSLQGSGIPAKLKQIELVPVVIEDFGQPRMANETEIKNIFNKIQVTDPILK